MAIGEQVIIMYLKRNGIIDQNKIKDIIDGFDLSKPIYERRIWTDEILFQFVRNPSFASSK